jgi:DNA polymerase III subunit delta
MELRAENLNTNLSQGLKFCYVLAGEETLLVLEAADRVREAARAQGFVERHVFDVNNSLDWADVRYQAQAMGLFASQKLIELRLTAPKLDSEGVELLQEWAERPPEGILLLITLAEWKKDYAKQAWLSVLDERCALVIFWPVKREELPKWLETRARALKLNLDPDAALELAERVEGNLFAAKQALDQIQLQMFALKRNNSLISGADIEAWVADSAHFSTASLVDSMLLGEAARAVRILRSLQQEGEEAFMISSALIRQVELLCELSNVKQSAGMDAVRRLYPMRGVWPARQKLYERALGRSGWSQRLTEAAYIDQLIKGRAEGNAALELERWLLRLCLAERPAHAFALSAAS